MYNYRSYMDEITVSSTLHSDIMACVTEKKPAAPRVNIKRYAAACACLAVILLGAVAAPKLLPTNDLGSGISVPAPGPDVSGENPVTTDDPIAFYRGDNISATRLDISVMNQRELTQEELLAIFPNLGTGRTVTAIAVLLDNDTRQVDARVLSQQGYTTQIQTSPDDLIRDCIIIGDHEASLVHGVSVDGGYFVTNANSKGLRNIIYFASFQHGDINYYVELWGAEKEKDALQGEITTVINNIVQGEAADFSAVSLEPIPNWRDDTITQSEAREDEAFGAYLPQNLPAGFGFEAAYRRTDWHSDYLMARWNKGMAEISWLVSPLQESDKTRMTAVEDTKNYDLSLYPIPRADSVPMELREIVENPIFNSEELTLDVVKARAYEVKDAGDVSGARMRFAVLYGDVLVQITVKGATPEAVFAMLS